MRAEVTDRGLARRLGEDVFVIKKGTDQERPGKLVYFPDCFAVRVNGKDLTPIEQGDYVGLKTGQGVANFDEHFVRYKYSGR